MALRGRYRTGFLSPREPTVSSSVLLFQHVEFDASVVCPACISRVIVDGLVISFAGDRKALPGYSIPHQPGLDRLRPPEREFLVVRRTSDIVRVTNNKNVEIRTGIECVESPREDD